MKLQVSPVLTTYDIARQRVYQALLAEAGRDWTVAIMVERLPDVAVNDVRTILHLLLGDGLVDIEPVAGQWSLTLRLTGEGEQTLGAILHDWATDSTCQAASVPAGGRNAQ
ncbi:hypothetical protein [Allorhizocola rhizosphaerae]|uniref:hypothetical protein n=1 Tax=Allorhizocola rhizosphaerae TaxID=1872709 RepID=UPI000E3BE231|nr:hypothetical protein [Allorhizocola rhizosphaerae]